MAFIELHAPSVLDWTPKQTGDWYSSFSPSVYYESQIGRSRHPLQDKIEEALDFEVAGGVGFAMVNGPTGCAPDVAAYLSGEPDCMIDFDIIKNESAPIEVFIDIASSENISAEDVALHISNIASAAYQIGMSRPVTLNFYVAGRSNNKDYVVLLPKIHSWEVQDSRILALISDTRTVRESCYGEIHKQNSGKKGIKWPDSIIKFDGVMINPLGGGFSVTPISKEAAASKILGQ